MIHIGVVTSVGCNLGYHLTILDLLKYIPINMYGNLLTVKNIVNLSKRPESIIGLILYRYPFLILH